MRDSIWNMLLQDMLGYALSCGQSGATDCEIILLSYRRHGVPSRVTRGYKRPQDARASYTKLERAFRRELLEQWDKYESGQMTLEEFEGWFAVRQQETLVHAFALGLAGRGIRGKTRFTDDELRYLHGQYSQQMRYFHRFMRDVRAGRGRMPYRQRLELYGRDLYGVFMTAWFAYGADRSHRFLWRLSPDAEHCEDCVQRATESRAKDGYTYDELIRLGLPGTGKTRCLNNCRCWIQELTTGQKTTPRRLRPKR
jgi:hypothetical protein